MPFSSIDSIKGINIDPVDKGNFLYTADSFARKAFLLLDGVVRLDISGPNGNKVSRLVTSPSIIGHEAFLPEEEPRYTAFAEALTPLQVQRIYPHQVGDLIRKNPKYAHTIVMALARHAREQQTHPSFQPRLARDKITEVVQNISTLRKTHPDILFTQDQIGALAGTRREIVSDYRDVLEPIQNIMASKGRRRK